jgi:glucose-6-phosphate isomerase
MSSAIAPLSQRPAWAAFARDKAIASLHLRRLFADDPARGEGLALVSVGSYLVESPWWVLGDKCNE